MKKSESYFESKETLYAQTMAKLRAGQPKKPATTVQCASTAALMGTGEERAKYLEECSKKDWRADKYATRELSIGEILNYEHHRRGMGAKNNEGQSLISSAPSGKKIKAIESFMAIPGISQEHLNEEEKRIIKEYFEMLDLPPENRPENSKEIWNSFHKLMESSGMADKIRAITPSSEGA